MIYILEDTSKVKALFDGWQETLIYSCLQKVMGKVYVTDLENPKSALAFVGCFGFYAGEPNRELVMDKPQDFVIMTPQNDDWANLIERCYPTAERVTRYAIKKDTKFDTEALRKNLTLLPAGYRIAKIDGQLYDKCITDPLWADFVSTFDTKEAYLHRGRGIVILNNEGEIASGASSYTRYTEGIEIEVDTAKPERRKNLATVACSALILECLQEGLYPSWDAQNRVSVHLAEKLGYEFDREYTVYVVDRQSRIMSQVERYMKTELMKIADNQDNIPRMAEYRIEHSFRVAHIAAEIARAEGLDAEKAYVAGLLHDIGYSVDFRSKEEYREHGRIGAGIARRFLKELGCYGDEEIEEMCYAIAIHVDEKADFPGEKTPFTLSVGEADNIDRFDAYRLYEGLHAADYVNLPLEEQRMFVEKRLAGLARLLEEPFSTKTSESMWKEKIRYQIDFYKRLKNQIERSY